MAQCGVNRAEVPKAATVGFVSGMLTASAARGIFIFLNVFCASSWDLRFRVLGRLLGSPGEASETPAWQSYASAAGPRLAIVLWHFVSSYSNQSRDAEH